MLLDSGAFQGPVFSPQAGIHVSCSSALSPSSWWTKLLVPLQSFTGKHFLQQLLWAFYPPSQLPLQTGVVEWHSVSHCRPSSAICGRQIIWLLSLCTERPCYVHRNGAWKGSLGWRPCTAGWRPELVLQRVVHFQAFFRIKHKVVGSCLFAECSPHGFQSVSLVKRLSLWLYWDGYFLCICHHSITSNGTSVWKAVRKTGRPSQGQRFGQVVKWPRSQGPLREPIIFHPKTQVRG